MRLICILLLMAGLTLSGYLLVRHFRIEIPSEESGPSACQLVFNADCDTALRSEHAYFWKLPLAGWGVSYFGTLLFMLGVEICFSKFVRLPILTASWGITLAGAIIGSMLVIGMISGTVPSCPVCFIIHGISGLLFLSYSWLIVTQRTKLVEAIKQIPSMMRSREPIRAELALQSASILGAILVFVIICQWVYVQQLLHQPEPFDVRDSVASFALTSRFEIPVSDKDPVRGPDDAEVEIIVFSDFQCLACRRFANELEELLASLPARVRVVFKHFPLNTACNPHLTNDRHPFACEFAFASESARRQNKFWDFHDMVFASDEEIQPSTLENIAADLDLDLEMLRSGIASDDVKARIREDIELGIRLGVDETPTVFVGGRRAPDARTETIYYLILAELANESRIELSGIESDTQPEE